MFAKDVMPPRSKQSHRQIDWLTCPHCSIRYSTRDLELHSEICTVETPFNTQLVNPKTLKHGFVVNGVIVSMLASADSKSAVQKFITIFIFLNPDSGIALYLQHLTRRALRHLSIIGAK